MEENQPVQKPINSLQKLGNLLRERWPEYVIEIAVIIISISLSFAFDEWKDNRHKQELEQLYLRELVRDIESDINQLGEIRTETSQIVQKANELIGISQKSAVVPAYGQFISNIRFIFKRPRFVAQNATFSDLQSTGNMQVLSSFPLKSALFDYYKHYESIVLIETAELTTTNALVGPFILKRLPLRNSGSATGSEKALLVRVLGEVEFQNALLVRASTRQELLQEYDDSLKEAKQILAALKAQAK